MSSPAEIPHPPLAAKQPVARLAWPLLIAITFLTTIGMTIVFPVLPFILRRYVPEASLALWVGILESSWQAC